MKKTAQILVLVLLVSIMGTSVFAQSRKSDDGDGYGTPQRRDTLSLVTPSHLKKAERLVAKKLPEYVNYGGCRSGEWQRSDEVYHRTYIKRTDLKQFGCEADYSKNESSVQWMVLKLTMSGEIVADITSWPSKRVVLGTWWSRR